MVISKDKGDDVCLCWNSEKEILIWIVSNISELKLGETLIIHRSPGFGYEVSIKKGGEKIDGVRKGVKCG